MSTTLSPEMKQRMVDIICSGVGELPVPAGVKIEVVDVFAEAVRFRVTIVDEADRELAEICHTGVLWEGDSVTILHVSRAFELKVS